MKQFKKLTVIGVALVTFACFCSWVNNSNNSIKCSNDGCRGQYKGVEFINDADIAHQFSNEMSAAVGNKLKELFHKGKYSKVDFDNIIMTTRGMGSGNVTYYLKIPFKRVNTKCDAYTSFDHVGGWNHQPALEARKRQLKKALILNHK